MAIAELMARTCFSLLEGASSPEEMVEAAARAGVDHLAIVDRDGVYGLVRAFKSAKRHGVHLVAGATFTVRGAPPLVLLAETMGGWGNLCRLLTAARHRGPKGFARIETEQVAERSGGLTCILGYGWAPDTAGVLREAFGDHLAIGLIRRRGAGDGERTRWATAMSSALGCPVVAGNAPLYHRPDRRYLADVLTCIRRRTTLMAAGKALESNSERYLLSEDALRHRFSDRLEALREAVVVAERCQFSLDELAYQYPREVVPEGFTAMEWLRERVARESRRRYPRGVPESVSAQLEHELGMIEELEFPSYFLTIDDVVRFARRQGILCQGRGAAANSAVCYVLGITSVDPACSSLLFERFLSRERAEPPDIDIDFEHERREEVIQYVYRRYGRERAALLDTVITWRGRSAIRDVGKVFGLSLDQVDRLAKATDRWSAGSGVDVEELVREAGLDPSSPSVCSTLEFADELRGMPRHISQHVGGFTITESALVDLVPVEPAAMDDRTVIQWDKDDVDELGFVKVDLLGLGILTCIRKAFDLVHTSSGRWLSLESVPADDPRVYEMFCRADTIGVFQIESRAQMSMLPRLKPRSFYDLVIEVSLVRPGPIQGGMVHPYLRRRNGEEDVSYPHEDLVPILERTMGVPLFQEQVMALAVEVGGFTPGEADELRRAMGTWRKRGILDAMGKRLVEGMIAKGIDRDYAQAIFQQILGFGEYGFPESHAASFARLVYVSGWLKYHHPAAFAASLLNSQPMGFYSPRAIISDAQRHGVAVEAVCVRRSAWDCTLETEEGESPHLRLGLRMVRGLREAEGRRVEEAQADGRVTRLVELARAARLSRAALEALADADAFRVFGFDRRRAVWEIQGLWTDLPLFAGLARRESEPSLPPEASFESLRADYRSMGLSVEHHPMEFFREALEGRGVIPLERIASVEARRTVNIAGLVGSRQRPGTSKGVVFMTIEDETGMCNLVIRSNVWSTYWRIARSRSLLGFRGIVQRQGDAISVLVDHIWTLEEQPSFQVSSRDFH